MKSGKKFYKNEGRLNYKVLKKGMLIHKISEDKFSIPLPINKTFTTFKLIKAISDITTYIPNCNENNDDVDDNCDVFGIQKWVVLNLNSNKEENIKVHFFITKWLTLINNPTLYNKYMPE